MSYIKIIIKNTLMYIFVHGVICKRLKRVKKPNNHPNVHNCAIKKAL